MQNVDIIIGSNFGDEGKGLMTDYFCSRHHHKSVNVRFNGGSQAGHTVVTPHGIRHVFSHIGSGFFNLNVDMYLSKHFIFNPIKFISEYNSLKKYRDQNIIVHCDCMVTTPYDMMINEIIEDARGNEKHGSCGNGIYETIHRNNSGYKLTIDDIVDSFLYATTKIDLIRKEYVYKRLAELKVDIPIKYVEYFMNENIFNKYIQELIESIRIINIAKSDNHIADYDNIIFEGAQGLLLDQNNLDYFPHLTPSNTGLKNVVEILNNIHTEKNIQVCYVTRSYLTRHGAGKFESECDKILLSEKELIDKTNITNKYQGDFRYGYFDKYLISNTIQNDTKLLNVLNGNNKISTSLAITHLNETDDVLQLKNGKISPKLFSDNFLPNYNLLLSYGETRDNFKNIER